MQVGSAELSITPPIPIVMGGYGARVGPAEGIHDPLFVRCLVFGSGSVGHGNSEMGAVGTAAHALLAYDLVALPEPFVNRVKSRIEAACGIPAGQIVLHATHTHSGPDLGRFYNPDAADEQQILYTDYLVALSVTACLESIRNLEPVHAVAGQQQVSGVGSVRRLAQGLALPVQVTGWFRNTDATLKAVIVSFPCHPTVMGASNRLLSADYPGVVVKTVKRLCGAHITVLPLTGAAGDMSTRFTRRSQTFDEVERLGTMVGAAAVRTLLEAKGSRRCDKDDSALPPTLLPVAVSTWTELVTTQATFQLDVQPGPDEGVLAELKRTAQQALAAGSDVAAKRIIETQLQGIERALSERRRMVQQLAVTVSVWMFGGVVYVFWPGEPFHSYDVQLKQALAETVGGITPMCILVGYSDGMIGYIPDVSLAEDASYEVLMSLIGDVGGNRLLAQTTDLLQQVLARQ